MGWLTRHRIGGIHKEVKAQTKMMQAQAAADLERQSNATPDSEKDEAYWDNYVRGLGYTPKH